MTIHMPDDAMYEFSIRHNTSDLPEKSYLFIKNILFDAHSTPDMFDDQERYILEAEVIWDEKLLCIENLFSDHLPSKTTVGPLIVTNDGIREVDSFKWGHSALKCLHHVAACLSLKTIELMDNSKLRLSEKLVDSYSLRCIRYLQERDGYYEEHGYSIKNEDGSLDIKSLNECICALVEEFRSTHPSYIPLPNDLLGAIESGTIDKKVVIHMCNRLSHLLHPFQDDLGLLKLHRNVRNDDLIRGLKIKLTYAP